MVKVVTPLDAGRIADHQLPSDGGDGGLPPPTLQSEGDIGAALRAIREYRRLSLDEVAAATRVRRAYLADLEAMRLDRLPSRPFTMGYIKAYAEALGLDGDAAVERFKAEEPDLDEPLHAPVGVAGAETGDPRVAAIVAAVVVIVAAIILWNVAQRTMMAGAPPPPTASARAAAMALAAPPPPVFKLGAPLPAPVESTVPPLYHTPGMPDDGTVQSQAEAKLALKPDGEAMVDISTLPPVFVATAKVYGAPAGQPSTVTLQALKSASLIVRGADGSIYFARQFQPGEAFRAPQVGGLVAEVSDPTNFQVFLSGQSKGVLPAAQTSLTQLAQGGAPAAPTRVASAAPTRGAAKPASAAPRIAPPKPASAPDEAPH